MVKSLVDCGSTPQDNNQTVVVDKYQAEEGQELEYDMVVRHDSMTTVTAKAFHTSLEQQETVKENHMERYHHQR